MLKGLASAMHRGNIHVIGVVLNMVTPHTARYYGYEQYYYYRYAYEPASDADGTSSDGEGAFAAEGGVQFRTPPAA
jgi:hypothetical protein